MQNLNQVSLVTDIEDLRKEADVPQVCSSLFSMTVSIEHLFDHLKRENLSGKNFMSQ